METVIQLMLVCECVLPLTIFPILTEYTLYIHPNHSIFLLAFCEMPVIQSKIRLYYFSEEQFHV